MPPQSGVSTEAELEERLKDTLANGGYGKRGVWPFLQLAPAK
jgi:hypothetical protein